MRPREANTSCVGPAYQGKGCKKHDSCIIGAREVYRTRSSGRSWEKLTDGLPRKVHCVVLRHGMDADTLRPAGVYFATTTGEVYRSEEHTSELQSLRHLVCRLLLEKKNKNKKMQT